MSERRTLPIDQSAARAAAPAAQRAAPLAYQIDDAAQLVGVSKSTIWRLIQEGRLPARRLDGSTIIRHADLATFIDGLPLVRQLAEPSTTPPPVPPLPVPRPTPAPLPPPVSVRQRAPPVDLRQTTVQPKFAPLQPSPVPARPDKQAPYGRGRTGKPLPAAGPEWMGCQDAAKAL